MIQLKIDKILMHYGIKRNIDSGVLGKRIK